MADNTIKATGQAEDVIRLDRPFDYEGYQVVRQEFFAHVNEPAVTFNNYKFYGNAACLRKFPDTEFVQVLIESSWCCALAGRKTGTPFLGGRRNQKSRNRPPAACSSPRCLS